MHRFGIKAIRDPQSLPRITGFFAQRAILLSAMRMEAQSDFLRIDAAVTGLPEAQAIVIAAKLREIFVVIDVELTAELAAVA